MIIVGGKRYCGKTTELIKISAANQIPIVVLNNKRGEFIERLAKRMNMKIPKTIPYYDKEKLIGRVDKIVIDDVEDILQDLFHHNRIVAVTTSETFVPMEQIKK